MFCSPLAPNPGDATVYTNSFILLLLPSLIMYADITDTNVITNNIEPCMTFYLNLRFSECAGHFV